MSTYAAPVRDMLFTMKEIAGLDAICAQPGNEDFSPDLVEAVLEEAGRFATGVLDPLNRVGDVEGVRWQDTAVSTSEAVRSAYASFCENGWNGMPEAAEYGGQGMPNLVSMAVGEMWKASNLAFSLCQMLTLGAVHAISHHGSERLKATYLEPMVQGRWTGTMNLTEPQAGSDLAALRSRAVPEGDHYRVFGQKIFITWGEHDLAENIVHLVLARLPDAPPGVKGISLFLCPKFLVNEDGSLGARNDLACTSVEHKLGIHASPTASMSFGEKDGAIGHLVGEANEGLACMFTMMNHARLNVGLEGVGVAERAYQHARTYALERVQGRTAVPTSKTIIGHPDVRRMLMDMKARTEAMRALAYFCAGEMDRAQGASDAATRQAAESLVALLTPVVKGWCTDSSIGIASDGVQIHGGMGFVEETGAAQYYRDARITTIYEGTTGIQANDLIGRKLAREDGRTMRTLITRIDGDAGRLAASRDAGLAELGADLQAGLGPLDEATRWLLETGREHTDRCLAGAVPYLRLTGTVVGAWLSALGAEAAARRLAEGDADRLFLTGKIDTARHFAAHVLPQAGALRDTVIRGARSTLSLSDEQF